MATDEYMSTYISSDYIIDFKCTLCDTNKEAVHFCVECQEYLCLSCTDYHKRLRLMAGHTLLGESEFTSRSSGYLSGDMQPTATLPAISTERCPKHPAELIKMYCGVHDRVMCLVCTTIYHRTCNDLQHVADVADQLYKEQMSTDIKEALTKASKQMQHLRETLLKATYDLETGQQMALGALQKFRIELNQMLDELEKHTTEKLNNQCQSLNLKYQTNIQKVTASIDELDKQTHQLNNSCGYDRLHQFVLTKMSQECISAADIISSQLIPRSIQISFCDNVTLKSFLEKVVNLGYMQQVKLGLYKVTQSSKYDVKIGNDRRNCGITGSCVLDSGAVLLVDIYNQKLKLFDMNKNAVTSYCTLCSDPYTVCTVSEVEAAVSLANSTIQFFTIGEHLVPTKTIRVNHDCFGLAIADGNMYITALGGSSLYVHNMEGELLKEINKDQLGYSIFSNTSSVKVSDNGKIYVTDFKNGLITLETWGEVVWKYSGSDLTRPVGACTDGCGNVFVCGLSSQNVLQLGQDGQKLGELVTQLHGLNQPQSVCFDKNNSRLIIANKTQNNILVISLE